MDLKTFNRELNTSYDQDNKYVQWTDYRHAVTDFIVKKLVVNKGTVLVLASGNCHDLDLQVLIQENHRVILSDIDGKSMEDGLKKQRVYVETFEIDYLGLSEIDWLDELQKICLSGHQVDYTNWLTQLSATVKEKHFKWQGAPIDVTICLPIYTQLLFAQVEGQLRQYLLSDILSEEVYNNYLRGLLDMMPKVIAYFNEGLLDLARKGSQLIVLSDCLEDVPEGQYSQAYEAGEFQQAYDLYCESYGMGLGHYGLYDLEAHYPPIESRWFRWPFAEDRVLYVRGIIIKVD